MKRYIFAVGALLIGLGSGWSAAPAPPAARPHVKVPVVAPRPADVATLDGMVKAFYETITGPAGQPRDWGRDRTLYIPDARFVTTGTRGGKPFARVFDHQAYADGANAWMVKNGFFEKEIHRVTQKYGNLAHVMSTFESRGKPDGPVTERGVNSISLYWDGKRWWIYTVGWEAERPGSPIPKEFLP